MSTDIVAADQLKAIVQRVERLEAEIADLNADKSEIYKEARANGFDVKVIKKVVSKRKIDEHERVEQDHVFDLYWDAVHGLNLVYAHARENIEQFDANPRLIKQVVDGIQSEAGKAALLTAINIMIDREEAEELEASDGSPSVSSTLTTREPEESVVSNSPETATEQRVNVHSQHEGANAQAIVQNECVTVVGTESGTVANPEMDRATEGSFETGSEAAEKGRKATATVAAPADLNHAGAGESPAADITIPSDDANAAANAGGDHVDGNALRVPTSVTGEGAAKTALPAGGVVMEYVPPTGMKRLPFAHCFPDHSKPEYERLEKDIAANRVREPIIRQGDIIVDGWARYNISRAYGMSYPVVELHPGRDVLLGVIKWQRAARNFTPAQERKIAAELAKEFPSRADDIMAAFGLAEDLEAAE